MIKAILFDMDGVLIDAKDWHYEALNDALALFGMEIGRDAHLSTYDGLPTRTKLEMLTETRGLPRRLHSVINQVKQKRTAEIAIQRCKPTFNHAFALSRLRDDDMKMAVCSNSIRKTIELMMELSDLSQHLDLIVSNEDVSKAKPDPEMYLKAMSELGVQPHETLILEDNEHGIQAARASGAQVLVIGTPDDVEYARIKQAMAEAVS
ncbi:Phosphorylated carbohydrates phosphatase TM_1254 [Brevundimonas diminuta]|jgi:HAD superfamily hydrolase (TIGR01509 family)|uniref:HAD family hydrolase n=1 Tax=Brevundimonas diminuta TaxID=293 RepID=UPI000207EAB5|nr:HAD family phosphatase [Brevundimonas diminuta]EGF96624.1 beta-phosphoglucomutase [Brevundimonas diminuta ATCC 11568]SPU45633.1 Phosphorylated carbohydrates phosphatase TM_1254 [Brevundimonas diminuta]SUW17164.1 Phosphorylated carbohydrates phosphatase TM_1254 [Brevundimonas diminuta]